MSTTYPVALDAWAAEVGTNALSASGTSSVSHAGIHTDVANAIEAIEAYLGTNASLTAPGAANRVLRSTSATASSWASLVLTTDVTGVLPIANGGTNAATASDAATALGLGTGDSPQFTAVNIGHATDTTISRASAGVVAIEGVNVLTVAGGTLTGNIVLGENTAIALDPAGSADGKYSGITVAGIGGTTIAFGDLIYLAVADSRWELVDADAIATSGMLLGMAVTSSTDGAALTILLFGIIRADANFPTFTIGSPVYAGETAGDVQVAVPTGTDGVIRVVGYALTADEMFFNPSPDHITIT